MLIGRKDLDQENFNCLPVLPAINKRRAFTLLEVMVVVFILLAIVTALFISLSTGDFASSVSTVKADLQAKIRSIVDWIVKDVHGTSLLSIANSIPPPNPKYIKFQEVVGIDNNTGKYTYDPTNHYIEYNYDATSKTLTRQELAQNGAVVKSTVFYDITALTFYSYYDPVSHTGTPLDPNGILNNKTLFIVITGQSLVKNSLTLSYSLTENIDIRNKP